MATIHQKTPKRKTTTKPSAKKKSWREKLLDSKGLPKRGPNRGKLAQKWGRGTHVVPAPVEVDALMRRVRPGRLTTIDHLRQKLARRHGQTAELSRCKARPGGRLERLVNATWHALAELLGERDDDALGSADVG